MIPASGPDFSYVPPADAVQPTDRSSILRMAQIESRKIVVSGVLAVLLLVTGAQVAWCQPAERLHGLPNFGRVTDNLYRGGQPSLDGFNALHAMGVGMVVNFREESGETATEKREVESLGIRYIGIPWSATHKPPTSQVVQFLDLVRANPTTRIFVHCRRGADRTGLMIAAYRISVEHEPVTEAVAEMHQFHYDWLFLPQLKHYVERLPGLLQNDPQFAEYRLPSVKQGQSAP
jgi:tyrosine-protein phosphatase SIW14